MSHPMGMYVISVTEMWERFSFYIFVGILVLFMFDVLHFSMPFSTFLYGIIIGATYFLQLIAGYLSDRYLGNRKAIIIGGTLMLISQIIFTYDASLYYMTLNVAEHSALLYTYPEIIFLIGSVIMAIGASFFKVSITSFVGLFYPGNQEKIDSAYTIFYMLINVGGFLAPLALHFVVGDGDPSLYQYGFMVGAITIFIALAMFIALKNKYLRLPDGKPIGIEPISKNEHIIKRKEEREVSEKLSSIEIDRLKVILFILIIITVFFVAHEQITTSMVPLAMVYLNNVVPIINYYFTPQFYMALNPLFIIIMSPLFIKFTDMLAKRNKEPSSISKMGIGLLFVGVAYIMLVIPFSLAAAGEKINMSWVVLYNIFLVIAELLIMPIALSLISKLAPLKYASSMVGVLFAATGVSEILSGYFASAFPSVVGEPTKLLGIIPIADVTAFMWVFVIISFVVGALWLLIGGRIRKLMHGVN